MTFNPDRIQGVLSQILTIFQLSVRVFEERKWMNKRLLSENLWPIYMISVQIIFWAIDFFLSLTAKNDFLVKILDHLVWSLFNSLVSENFLNVEIDSTSLEENLQLVWCQFQFWKFPLAVFISSFHVGKKNYR